MSRIAASLAAVLLSTALWAGCGGDGAEPDAPSDGRAPALVLDFQPNAVHSGIYAALADGLDLEVREPGTTSDAPKLLAAGRTDLAIMDVNDLGIAREQGAEVVAVGAIVQRPLAAVIASGEIGEPRDLSGRTVGVTGLPSDDAVLDTVLEAAGVDPGSVDRQTIGFESVPLLAAGRVDAATAFWNAEGVALGEEGVSTHEFRVDDFGAPAYPELVLVTTEEKLAEDPEAIKAVTDALARGYADVAADPASGLDALLDAEPSLNAGSQTAQLEALLDVDAFTPPLALQRQDVEAWADWALEVGILSEPLVVEAAFDLD